MTQIADEWQIRCWYLLMLVLVVAVAKLVSWRLTRRRQGPAGEVASFILAPSLCLPRWQRRKRRAGIGSVVRAAGVAILQLALLIMVYRFWVPAIRSLPWWLASYLAVVPFWLLLETLEGWLQLFWFPSGRLVPVMSDQPYRSAGLAEFWGKRWNRLFGDWLHQVVFMALRRRPTAALFATFLVSGLIHELLVSLPLALVGGGNVWGWCTAYFLLQPLAMVVEHRWRPSPLWRRIFCWLVVLVPVVLVLNPATLRIFHFWGG